MIERRSVSVWVFTDRPLRVLLLRRPATRAPGWQPITGRVEPTDVSLEAACVREIHEESSLGAPQELLDLGIESSFAGYDGTTYHQRSFAARYSGADEPRISEEHEEARWVIADEARSLLQWEADREALDALRSVLSGHVR